MRVYVDFDIEAGLGFGDIGGGAALQVYFYDPVQTELDTWEKSYSLDIAPGRSYKVKLTQKEFYNKIGVGDQCIKEGTMG